MPVHAQQITPLPDTTSVKVEIKANSIYNNGELIGSYKQQSIDSDLTFLKVYNRSHSRIAEVTHEQGAPTWTIVTPVDQKKMYAPYLSAAPLAGLFRYLVQQGYF
ncbi:MAG: hypothetical protein P4L41_08110 [Flavipsychrobacter sp.]|nr:hypothetical protein [Flavipsychrobacter sp.]